MALDKKYVLGATGRVLSITRRRSRPLENRVPLLPSMHLMAGRTLDRVLILDRQRFERLRVHRKTRKNQLARFWALDQYAVQPFLIRTQTDEAAANKGPLLATRVIAMPPVFRDRRDAGRRLAAELSDYADQSDLLVLALPRGGVPVAYEVARALHAPLDVFMVRKLGVPGYEELAMGAIATGGLRVLDEELLRMLDMPREVIERVTAIEMGELERREREYRGDRPPADVRGRTIILIDDGLATGSTMRAAIAALKKEGAKRIVVAVPVAPSETCEALRDQVDEVVCAVTPEPFRAVGIWYGDFSQTTDEEVRDYLAHLTSALT
jgi:predicted phosphoribosyltransferase